MPDDHEIHVLDEITGALDSAESKWSEYEAEVGDVDGQRRIKTFLSDRFADFLTALRP